MNTIRLNTIGTPFPKAEGGGGDTPSSEEWIYWDVSNVSEDDNNTFRLLAHLINAEGWGIQAGGTISSVYATKWATNLNFPYSVLEISDSPILMKEYLALIPPGADKTTKALIEERGFVEITEDEFYALY